MISEAVYRANGVPGWGFVDRDRPGQIWTVAVPATGADLATPKRITSGEFAAGNHRWSRDGAHIYFISDRRRESYYFSRDSDLYSVPKDGGEPARVISIEGNVGGYSFSPDGKRVAFVGTLAGQPDRWYSQSDLFVADLPEDLRRTSPRATTSTSTAVSAEISGRRGAASRAARRGAATAAR